LDLTFCFFDRLKVKFTNEPTGTNLKNGKIGTQMAKSMAPDFLPPNPFGFI
jgi:hypothetical protein